MKRLPHLALLMLLMSGVITASATEIFTAAPSTWPCGNDPRSVSVGDLNGDGALDLVVVNTESGTYTTLINDGTGSFGSPFAFSSIDEEPRDVVLADFDDLFGVDMVIPCTGDYDSGWTEIFLNTGFGFVHHQTYSGGDGPWHCVVDEFDGEPGLDIVVTYPWNGSLGTHHNVGDGDFTVSISYLTEHPIQLDKMDIDGDGDMDIFFTQSQAPFAYGVCYALNDGFGHFNLGAKYSIGAPTGGIAAGDFNGDGIADVALGQNTASGNDNLRIYFGRPEGGLQPPVYYGDLANPIGLAAADFDRDEDIDLAVCGLYSDYVAILHNDGLGGFAEREIHPTAGGPYRLRVADINEDEMPDLVVACLYGDAVQIFQNAHPTGVGEAASVPAGILGIMPNPFNPSGQVRYRLAQAGQARVAVYDTRGSLVRELRHEWQPAGEYAITWDGRDDGGRSLASGVYLIELDGPAVHEARKATLLK